MYIIEIQVNSHIKEVVSIVVSTMPGLFSMITILENSTSAKAFKIYHDGFRVEDVKQYFGLGYVGKFTSGLFTWD